jgi:hypothetical protein
LLRIPLHVPGVHFLPGNLLDKAMRFLSLMLAILFGLFAAAQIALAAPQLSVNSPTAGPGDVVPVVMSFAGNGTTLIGVQFDLSFDSARFIPSTSMTTSTFGGASCSVAQTGLLRCVGSRFDSGPIGDTGNITLPFSVRPAAAVGVSALTFSGIIFIDNNVNQVPSGPSTNGVFTVVVPAAAVFSATPNANSTLDFGQLVFSTMAQRDVLITNPTAVGGLALRINQCSVVSTLGNFALLQPASFPQDVARGNSLTIATTFASGSGPLGLLSGTLNCTYGAPAIAVNWPLRAEVVLELIFANGFED